MHACLVAGSPARRAVVPEEPERSRLQPSPRDDPPAHLQTPAEVYTLRGQSSILLRSSLQWRYGAQLSVYSDAKYREICCIHVKPSTLFSVSLRENYCHIA